MELGQSTSIEDRMSGLFATEPVELVESDSFFNHRASLEIPDPPGDNAAAFDFKVNIFDPGAVGYTEGCIE
jgi:hypothetical protein